MKKVASKKKHEKRKEKEKKKSIEKNSKKNKFLPVEAPQFNIPQQFLAGMNEFCEGGYVLIIGGKGGDPQIYSHFDNIAYRLGFIKFCADYFDKLDSDNTERLMRFVDNQNGQPQQL